MEDLQSIRLVLACVEIAAADPPVDETPPSLTEVIEAVNQLKGGTAAGACNVSEEMLKTEGEAMIHVLHVVLTAFWQSGTSPSYWKRE